MRTSRRTTIAGERPLSPAERAALVVAAASTTLLFYVIVSVASAILLVSCSILVIILVGAARVGLAGVMAPMVERQWELLKILLRSLWLRDGALYRLEVKPNDAPRLFALTTALAAKMDVKPPSTIVVEMTNGAWVELHGFLRGGRTTLGVGYDLLAGLPEHEVEGVLAHEMAHARLVNRGLSRWMKKTLGRSSTMTQSLGAFVDTHKQAKRRSYSGELLLMICDNLTIRSVRLVATYSRQDEFEADAGAAEACGAASIRWALIHLDRLSNDLERLPWSERIARLETEQSFSRWLVGALALESVRPRDQMRDAVDQFSTHPSLRDRIKAIGAEGSVAIPGRPGVELLKDPDKVATLLVAEIHRTATREERKDDKALRASIRKLQKPTQTSGGVWLGVAMVAAGILILVVMLTSGMTSGAVGSFAFIIIGARMLEKSRHRDAREVPIPAYGTLTPKRIPPEEIEPRENAIESELRARFAAGSAKPNASGYIGACFDALKERDYLRAHVAGRLALGVANSSVDAALGMGIAAAALGNARQSADLHEFVRKNVGWRTPNIMWGVAWARTLMEDHATCEALLALLLEKRADQPTFQSLMGYTKMSRGKMRTAEMHMRKAVAVEPSNRTHAQLLTSLYLESGRIRDAIATLSTLRDIAETDMHVASLFLRLELLRHNEAEAARWADVAASLDPEPTSAVGFGFMFESARFDERARGYFERALSAGHFPEAHIGLARLESAAGDREVARQHLLEALNAERERPASAQSPIGLLHNILAMLNSLEDQRVNCRAWIVTVPEQETAGALAGRSVLVCAPDQKAADAHVQRVLSALYPSASLPAGSFEWKDAPADKQPVRPIAAGVQHVM